MQCSMHDHERGALTADVMDDIGQQTVPALTPELWSNVFAHVEELPENFDTQPQDQQQNQAEVHQLKLVCKQFRDICASHSVLVQRLYLADGFSSERSLPSFDSLATTEQELNPNISVRGGETCWLI